MQLGDITTRPEESGSTSIMSVNTSCLVCIEGIFAAKPDQQMM